MESYILGFVATNIACMNRQEYFESLGGVGTFLLLCLFCNFFSFIYRDQDIIPQEQMKVPVFSLLRSLKKGPEKLVVIIVSCL